MKRHPSNVFRTNTQRSAYPAGGKVLLAMVLLLLAVSPPLFGQPPDGMASPRQRVCGDDTDDIGEGAKVLSDSADADRIACFDRVWSDYQDNVWFYGEKGQHIVPAMDFDWLVVRLAEKGKTDADAPPGAFEDGYSADDDLRTASFDAFNARYEEYFSHFLHDPSVAPAMAAYRLRRDMPKEVFQTLMTRLRQDRQVRYVHPAWKIADRLYAPLEQIEIVWKTSTDLRQRQALLQAVGAVASDSVSAANTWRVSIDPSRQSVWQSANLLAEDIFVERARPLLMVLEPPVGVRFEMGMNGATPGTAIPFSLEIRYSDRVKIESSTIADLNLKPRGIFHNLYDIRYDAPLSSIDLNHSPIRVTGQIKIYATGEYNLPGIPVYYTDNSAPGSRIQLVKTGEKPVRIAGMIPAAGERHDLQVADFGPLSARPASATPAATSPYALLMLCGLTLLGLSALAAIMLRRRLCQPDLKPENHALTRHRLLIDAAASALAQNNSPVELAELGFALRNYLAEYAGLDEGRRGGSHASFFHRIESTLPEACRMPASELLALIDRILAGEKHLAIPDDLAGRTARLAEALQNVAEPLEDTTEQP